MPDHTATDTAPNHPRSRADLFLSFTVLALQGFGGVLAVVQRELVDRKRWMTREQFVEDWAVAQILPGPNVVNLALMIGGRYFGLGGALSALAGMLAVPTVVVLLIAALYGGMADTPQAQGALRGMGAVAAGLIIGSGLKLTSLLRQSPLGTGACAAVALLGFMAVGLLRWPLPWVLLGLGGPACLLAYARLGALAGMERRA